MTQTTPSPLAGRTPDTVHHTGTRWIVRAAKPAEWPEFTIETENGIQVARVPIGARNRANEDAALIASAPDLLRQRDALAEACRKAEREITTAVAEYGCPTPLLHAATALRAALSSIGGAA